MDFKLMIFFIFNSFWFQVKDVVGEDLVIKYMAESESHPGLFIWPAREDVSRECRKQIVKKMPNPVLREDISSTRLQFFTFAELSPESWLVPYNLWMSYYS